ncbi:ExbD/TolR family protein [Rubinisphaera italica]|uniref:Biopolymer transport protein ExbD/TolR n=1 Tax=Rubinisphaera italica TaxID=2527969 RepID=A0A5C5XJF0_9PLAN|nr:biopolymer transporter ExbD [Rubinisphaera italica]TWT62759.1 Biopolymer transport protein ExbD/TolR [Rubinisphaera italica]
MRIRSVLTSDRDLGEDQTMTPMIDIVFLLLVFFVCVATDQVVEMSLPTELASGSVDAQQTEPTESWVTEVRLRLFQGPENSRSLIEMNGRIFTSFEEFIPTLKALSEISRDSPVLLDIEDDVPLGEVVQLYDACRSAEFELINFVMDRPAT